MLEKVKRIRKVNGFKYNGQFNANLWITDSHLEDMRREAEGRKEVTDPNLKRRMTMRASRPLDSMISSSVTRKARGIQEMDGVKRRKVRGGSKGMRRCWQCPRA